MKGNRNSRDERIKNYLESWIEIAQRDGIAGWKEIVVTLLVLVVGIRRSRSKRRWL